MTGLEDQLANLRCPLLGLFGNEDSNPSPGAGGPSWTGCSPSTARSTSSTATTAPGTRFFATDRPSYRQEQAVDGYARIAAFFARTIG